MRVYRDRFEAHLDQDEVMKIPPMGVAQKSVAYLHDYVLVHEDDGDFFPEAPQNAARFYSQYVREGKEIYGKLSG